MEFLLLDDDDDDDRVGLVTLLKHKIKIFLEEFI
jgi:hypothetical protein